MTLARWPPSATTFSALFDPLQLASWLMSIAAAFGAVPSNFTVPLTVAAVAGSIAVAAAGLAAGAEAAGCSAGVSFLLHPASNSSKHAAATDKFVIQIVLFMFLSPSSSYLQVYF